jgi:DNA polymerase elongation subunit (family B)
MTHYPPYLYIDIETVPIVENYNLLSENMKLLWQKKSKLIDKENENFEETFFDKAGIFSEFGKIMCIGLGYFYNERNENQFRVKTISNQNENELLQEFCEIISAFFQTKNKKFCGHNIKEFDLPFICRRLIINGIAFPKIIQELQEQKPWESSLMDTMQLWKFGDYKHFTSLNLLAEILQIATPKDDIDGSEVAFVFWKEKNLNRIATYCSKDVITTAQVSLKLMHLPLLSDEQIIRIEE